MAIERSPEDVTRRRTAGAAPKPPGADAAPAAGSFRSARDAFPSWDRIVEEIQEDLIEFSQGEAGGTAAPDENHFARLVSDAMRRNPGWGVPQAAFPRLSAALYEEFFGMGPLAPYLARDTVEEVLANTHNDVFVIEGGAKHRITPSPFRSEQEMRNFLARIFAAQGRALSISNPAEDGQLADGSRIHAQVPPLAPHGAAFSIRKFRDTVFTSADYIAGGMYTEEFRDDLRGWIQGDQNILISGGTGSGKTTLINSIGEFIPREDRLIVIENSLELQLKTDDTHYMQTVMRGATEGRGDEKSLTIRDCLRYALRLRPDRIIVGEVRSAEAYDLLQAMNTGHDGSLTTIHADAGIDAIARLESLSIQAGELPIASIQELMARAIDIIVQVTRHKGTSKREIVEAWQVIHPLQIPDDEKGNLAALRDRGQLLQIRPQLWMIPLYRRNDAGELVRLNSTVKTY